MADHGKGISPSQYSQTSEDESSHHNSQSLGQGTSHLVGTPPSLVQSNRSSPSPDQFIVSGGDGRFIGDVDGDRTNHHKKQKPPPKKPRGRPRGSRNKPKSPISITRAVDDIDQVLKPVIIEISIGCDVVEELIQFAQRRNVGLTVLSGSGSVTNVTLCHTFSHAPTFTLHGTFTMLSLSGNYTTSHLPSVPSAASSSSSLPADPSVPVIPWPPGYSCFTICVAGGQGQVYGGVVAGRIIAVSVVVVVAAIYKKSMVHRVINNNDQTDSLVVDLSDAEALNKGGMNNIVL